ncbi:MAG: hypothetical protein R2991_14065 [Thermoanaerobaculia bacterium]
MERSESSGCLLQLFPRFTALVSVLAALVGLALAGWWLLGRWVSGRLERSFGELERLAGGSLDLSRLDPLEVADEENAAYWLLAAGDAVDLGDEERARLGQLGRRSLSEWSEEDLREARILSDAAAEALTDFARVENTTGSDLGVSYTGEGVTVPPLVPSLQAGKLALIRARLALRDGDYEEYRRLSGSLGRASEALCGEWWVPSAAIGGAFARMQVHLAYDFAERETPDQWTAEVLALQLAEDPCSDGVERALIGEASLMVDWARREFGSLGALGPLERLRAAPLSVFWVVQWEGFAAAVTRSGSRNFVAAQSHAEWEASLDWWSRTFSVGFVPDLDPILAKAKGEKTARILAATASAWPAPCPGQRAIGGPRPPRPFAGERPVLKRRTGWVGSRLRK